MSDLHTKATVPLAFGCGAIVRDDEDDWPTQRFVRMRATWWQRVRLWLEKVVGV